MYKDCVRAVELDDYLKNFGFTRVVTDWEGGSWGNGLYLKKAK